MIKSHFDPLSTITLLLVLIFYNVIMLQYFNFQSHSNGLKENPIWTRFDPSHPIPNL